MTTALILVDDREDYGETRYSAPDLLGVVLYSLTFTIEGVVVRAISLRRAARTERENYARAN